MRKLTLSTTLAALLLALPATAGTIAGGNAANCSDKTAFTPIYADDGVTIAYWNNPTCTTSGGATPASFPGDGAVGFFGVTAPEEEPTDE